MVAVEATARKWGNSLGVIIPKEIVEEECLSDNSRVVFEVRRIVDLKSLRGRNRFKRNTQEIKDELRRGWE